MRPDLCSSCDSSGRRWTPYLLQATGRLLTNTASLLSRARRPFWDVYRFPHRQASGEMSHFIVALPSHRTFYRKLPKETAWHFCRNCENWPHAGYEERDNHNPPHEFCRGCIQKHRDERCEWANVELSPARSYRGTGDYYPIILGLLPPASYLLLTRRILNASSGRPGSTR